ncbi:Hsp70 family protein [Schlesneria paludicola]|uniref:Hsp70 family protein n=1 Tax=Schlesneria paludicola TaxID=360056 RepID=UPI000299FC0F|nr:molecular chaperone HscC [Schlesneria paludicola]
MGFDIGIDLGTTNSLCAVFRDGQPELIPNVHGSVLTPSVVGVLDDGSMLVGLPAKELRVTHPAQCAWCFKRWMGTNRKIRLGGRDYSAPELSSLILKSLKDDAEAFLKEAVTEAVITVPAYFNDHQRKATKLAAELAGLKVRRIINEPTAAALTYGFHEREAVKKLMVIDLGGGTFDVTLMEIFEGGLEIISTAGESHLGGEDFTNRLVATVLKQLGKEYETAELKTPLLVARLHEECERAKRQLLDAPQSRIRIPNDDGEINEKAVSVLVTREAFAKASKALVDRLKGPIGKVLRDGQVDPTEIDDLILVGGATRMPVVVDFVREFLSAEPLAKFNPDEVVALGAAVQAALISDNAAVSDMVMTDVCPFTLGVELAKEFGNYLEPGYFAPIIHRNTTIPVSKEQIFSTVATNQLEVTINVYQGEARKVKDNLKLGELSVKGIPPGPAGQPFLVRFTYDINGLLEVEACIPETGRKFQTVLTNHAADLTPKEIAAALEKMRKLKFYPRDDVKNKQLVLFCDRVVGEISPHLRESLEGAIDAFERAMSSGDREMFEVARSGLLIVLSSLGIEYESPEAEADQDDNELS